MTTTIGSLDLGTLNDLYSDSTQYFWFESDSSSAWGSGAHVTLYPESEFTNSSSTNYLKGQNILMNTDGLSIRNGVLPMMTLDNDSLDFNVVDTTNNEYTNVARFSAISTIGVDDGTQSYLRLDFHSMQTIDLNGNVYFEVKDLRDQNGEYNATDDFIGDGSANSFSLTYKAIDTSYTVLLNGVEVTSGIHKYNMYVDFDVSPAIGDTISVNYVTSSAFAKSYTLGVRNINGKFGSMSLAEGYYTTASGASSHAEGYYTTASGNYSHAEGYNTTASGSRSHAEGYNATASGNYSHAEGYDATASGNYSHAEGYDATASGNYSHAEGDNTTASNVYSHAEGYYTTASGASSHAEGDNTTASGIQSHAEGSNTTASGGQSHAEGYVTIASGIYSHAQNIATIAAKWAQTALGTWNIEDTSATTTHPNGIVGYGQYALIIGNGTSNSARSNALTVDWDGNVDISGQYKISGAQIGSVMRLKGASYSSPLGTSYKTLNLSTTAEINTGNAFTAASNGIQCAYAGTVHLIGKVRFNDGFTANDYMMAQIYNTTQSTAVQTGRIRTPTQVFNGDVWVNAYARVNANDVILLRAENVSGARGTVTIAECSLTACYISV